MSDGTFPNGLIVKKPHQNAPGFVKCKLSFKVDDFIQCLQQNNNQGWVNMDMKVSQKGELYVMIDTWQPNQQQAPPPQQGQQYQQQPQNQMTDNYPPQGQQYGNQAPQQQQPPQQQAPPQQNNNGGYQNPVDDIPFAPCE